MRPLLRGKDGAFKSHTLCCSLVEDLNWNTHLSIYWLLLGGAVCGCLRLLLILIMQDFNHLG